MLPSTVRNVLSARSEALANQLAHAAIDHHPIISPFEEEERWLSRRSQVLNLQVRLLTESGGAPDGPELTARYEAELQALQQAIVARYREMIEARMSDTHTVHVLREDGQGFVLLDAHERDARIARFRERVDGEMILARAFTFGAAEGRAQRIADLQQEWESIEALLEDLKMRKDDLNFPFVDASSRVSDELAKVRAEHNAVRLNAGAHEEWLSACREGDLVRVVAALLPMKLAERREFVNRWGQGGRSGFHFVCETNDFALINVLRWAGADLHAPTDRGRLPVHLAVRQDHGERSRNFLTWLEMAGANFHVRDADMRGPLNEAAHYNNLTAVGWLLDHGASLQEQDRLHRTALHVAAANGHADLVSYLLVRGADAGRANGAGERPLMEALLRGQTEVAQVFWDHGIWLTAAETTLLQRTPAWRDPKVREAYVTPLRAAVDAVAEPMPVPQPVRAATAPASTSRLKQHLSSLLS
jgi:hypothetical protein